MKVTRKVPRLIVLAAFCCGAVFSLSAFADGPLNPWEVCQNRCEVTYFACGSSATCVAEYKACKRRCGIPP